MLYLATSSFEVLSALTLHSPPQEPGRKACLLSSNTFKHPGLYVTVVQPAQKELRLLVVLARDTGYFFLSTRITIGT